MKLTITGSQLQLTDAMKQYAEKKMNSLEKFYEDIIEAKVVLGMETRHHNKGEIFTVECKLYVPGKDIFAKNTAKDLYAAIDMVRDELEAELKKHKVKIKGDIKKHKTEIRESKAYNEEEEDENA